MLHEWFTCERAGRIRDACVLAVLVVAQVLAPQTAAGQTAGVIEGRVVAAETGGPLSGVVVAVPETGNATQTDGQGRFRLANVPPGTVEIIARRVGLKESSRKVEVVAGETALVEFQLAEEALLMPGVVVSTTRETRRLSETAASVGVISGQSLREAKPTHPADVLGQVPGVWVNVTGGEGHMTAIRQPQTTKPVYLFLENGVPTRSTGFFNHNALYEVNLPQADRIEVLKGPATALYGSDAIGGVINVETQGPTSEPTAELYAEGGGFGYTRLLSSFSSTWGANGVRADVNLTRTDGWRDATGYDRQSGTIRWDSHPGNATTIRTIVTASRINQQTAGSSALPREDYLANPTRNTTPISRRDVRAFRASSTIDVRADRSLLSVTPFVRWNDMEIIPNWALTYDPTIYSTGHSSVGLLARARRDVDFLQTQVIAGVDIDYSPGSRVEHRIEPTRVDGVFTEYTLGDILYDYDVTFRGISPYVQLESSPLPDLHVSAGLRYDHVGFVYRNALGELDTGRWRRPPDAEPTYDHLSPKLGAAYEFGPALNVFASYTHGFRAPSEGQLFRQGTAENTLGLQPVTADSYEFGARGEIAGRLGYTAAVYRMSVENDILSFIQADGTPETQNAGETLHRGIELGLNALLTPEIRGELSYSRAEHTYESWSPRPGVDYAGHEMESAPRTIVSGRLDYRPSRFPTARLGFEWNRIGSYWMDAENTHRYDGHHLFHVHANIPLPHDLEVMARLVNVADTRFAETATYTAARGEELSPGMPRTVYLGLQYRWGR